MHLVKWAVALSIFWLLLSGFLQPLLLFFGVASTVLVLLVLRRMDAVDTEVKTVTSGHRIFRYAIWLIREIFKSSLHVTKLVWGSPKDVSPALATISAKNVPEKVRVLYANSITLTPGTLSVDLKGEDITVHALHKDSIEELKNGGMEKHITDIWGKANE